MKVKINVKALQAPAVNPTGDVAPAAKAPGFGENKGGHYYGYRSVLRDSGYPPMPVESHEWFPLYEENKDFTLRDARKIKEAGGTAVPSTTTIMGCLAKPQLEKWKMENAARAMGDIMAGPAVPAATTRDDLIDQAVSTASGASRGAMELGTRIHKAIENAVKGQPYDTEMEIFVQAVMAERAKFGIGQSNPEECLGSFKYGYAGRCDDNIDAPQSPMTIIDYKSRKSKGKKVPAYETDAMQVAAYGYAKWGNDFFKKGRGLIMAISTTTPGLITTHEYSGAHLVPAFKAYLALCDVWRYQNNYDARAAA